MKTKEIAALLFVMIALSVSASAQSFYLNSKRLDSAKNGLHLAGKNWLLERKLNPNDSNSVLFKSDSSPFYFYPHSGNDTSAGWSLLPTDTTKNSYRDLLQRNWDHSAISDLLLRHNNSKMIAIGK